MIPYLLMFQKDFQKRYYLHFLVILSTDITFSDQMGQGQGYSQSAMWLSHIFHPLVSLVGAMLLVLTNGLEKK